MASVQEVVEAFRIETTSFERGGEFEELMVQYFNGSDSLAALRASLTVDGLAETSWLGQVARTGCSDDYDDPTDITDPIREVTTVAVGTMRVARALEAEELS